MLVTPSLDAGASRAVFRILHPSFKWLAMASTRSGFIRDPQSGVPFRSENKAPQLEHRSSRHLPPVFPARTERLPRLRLPQSGHFGFTQHNSASGRWYRSRPVSVVVDSCGIRRLLVKSASRNKSSESQAPCRSPDQQKISRCGRDRRCSS